MIPTPFARADLISEKVRKLGLKRTAYTWPQKKERKKERKQPTGYRCMHKVGIQSRLLVVIFFSMCTYSCIKLRRLEQDG